MDLSSFISSLPFYHMLEQYRYPWEITNNLEKIIDAVLPSLGSDFVIEGRTAIHKSVVVEDKATIKGPVIVMANCNIGPHAYLREGVILDRSVKIGHSSEVKCSIICSGTALAHLNYVGNSIVGKDVNFEAGSIIANHYNERVDKRISVKLNGKIINTGVKKFGAVVGDYSKIGANGVLSPGTLLRKNSIVKRLELVKQNIEG